MAVNAFSLKGLLPEVWWPRLVDACTANLAEMRACLQDPIFHAEGDVETHTYMVMEKTLSSPNWPSYAKATQAVLLSSAFLHDIGKPATTKLEDGRITSRGHSRVGAQIARSLLMQAGVPFEVREQIVALILCHGRPPNIVKQDHPELEVIKTGWLCNNEQLVELATADMLGRIGPTAEPIAAVQLWQALAQELGCYAQPFPANSEARLLAFEENKDIRFFAPVEKYKGTMTLVCGLPGAGKDTWIKRNLQNQPVVSLDALRDVLDVSPEDNQGQLIQAAREAVRVQLRAGTDFVLNATNITKDMRSRWIRLARDYGFQVSLVYIEPPLQTILQQNAQRPQPVPEKVILRLAEKLEPPTIAEGHKVQYIIPSNIKA